MNTETGKDKGATRRDVRSTGLVMLRSNLWLFRLLLIPFALIVELAAWAMCWCVAYFSPKKGADLTNWWINVLPDKSWYIGER